MPVPANRSKLLPARGDKAALEAGIASLLEGEICYAIDEDRHYQKEGGSLVAVGADKVWAYDGNYSYWRVNHNGTIGANVGFSTIADDKAVWFTGTNGSLNFGEDYKLEFEGGGVNQDENWKIYAAGGILKFDLNSTNYAHLDIDGGIHSRDLFIENSIQTTIHYLEDIGIVGLYNETFKIEADRQSYFAYPCHGIEPTSATEFATKNYVDTHAVNGAWSRSGTTLSPTVAGDDINTSGTIRTTATDQAIQIAMDADTPGSRTGILSSSDKAGSDFDYHYYAFAGGAGNQVFIDTLGHVHTDYVISVGTTGTEGTVEGNVVLHPSGRIETIAVNTGDPVPDWSTYRSFVITHEYDNGGEPVDAIEMFADGHAVFGGDVEVGSDQTVGLVLTSPNGTRYRLVVDDAGALSTTAV